MITYNTLDEALLAGVKFTDVNRNGNYVQYFAYENGMYIVLYHPSYALRMKNSSEGETFFKNLYAYLDEIKMMKNEERYLQ